MTDDAGREGSTLYRWSCPYCDVTRTLVANGSETAAPVRNALVSHIRATNDERHGPGGTLPDRIEADDVANNVSTVDVRSELQGKPPGA